MAGTDEPIISVCIPTYNSARFLDDSIGSVIGQLDKENMGCVEICVSDNASTDNTKEVVRRWRGKAPVRILYKCNKRNLGADRNFINAVGMAKGRFCWLLGSDDIIKKGGINYALSIIRKNLSADIFVLSRHCYDISLKKIIPDSDPLKKRFNRNVLFKDPYDAVRNTASSVSFISILLFNRKRWNDVRDYEDMLGTLYIHIYKMLAMMKKGARVMYVRKEIVGWRSANDYYLRKLKYFGRLRMDVVGYSRIAAKAFGKNSREYRSIMNDFMGVHLKSHTIAGIKLTRNEKLRKGIFKLYFRYLGEFPKFWVTIFPFMLVPTSVYDLMSKIAYKEKYARFRKNVSG
ncbi:glycosyltransferase family 2 protein [Candidatus Woesearchaeota archaeon]|nr:glycosyltransferase family 2 protein [Candidatus Woesearchaeota archaeon]